MGINDKSIQECVSPALKGVDRGTGMDAFRATRAIHCNVSDTYEITFSGGGTINMKVKEGMLYPYAAVNILTTGSASIDAGDITLLY